MKNRRGSKRNCSKQNVQHIPRTWDKLLDDLSVCCEGSKKKIQQALSQSREVILHETATSNEAADYLHAVPFEKELQISNEVLQWNLRLGLGSSKALAEDVAGDSRCAGRSREAT